MTNKHAVKILREYLASDSQLKKEYKEAFTMATNALDLQIARKPETERQTYHEDIIRGIWCPTCGRPLRKLYDAHHCECGQSLRR